MSITKSLQEWDPDLEIPGRHPFSPSSGRVSAVSAVLVFLLGMIALPTAVAADYDARHAQSKTYDVYLGVVPAAQTIADAQLDRLHKMSGQYAEEYGRETKHLLVAVFRKADGQRVENAEVTAEVVEGNLLRVKRTQKPLNLRPLAGGTTYCNFFDLDRPGDYKVDVQIREQGQVSEKVTFVQTAD